ncbi:TPA: hypothetical protein DIC20_01215 [Candidatus Dependentiae bacterium]|nr:MAG: hypothetical protein US03_C0002G0149 [candidate division TM6 bacterium GW2011_GWF2_36_131]KKQ03582.1 MAG: hypothetical protein US13_C0002G0148 [candidate division TM6 bacterium GW2011_GWE2_36_25]KKQ20142.1 MAG: hypothetical protein US32_C0001G0039 [candidate division TM6 bacterium GW2011_GWA2_36_9]HBR70684.1 hypothetical protein [Candidatus Dependentiae bacterium]HCU00304.1 hypothetical protein [Candidatus Dependentiae bacterium]
MAAPIGHIYLALQMLTGPLNGIDEQNFLIGTSFPDIRYPAKLPRQLTHAQNVTLQGILKEQDPFKQGMLFHAFVDQQHGKFIKEQGIEALLPRIPHATGILKGVEDLILFKKMPNRSFLRHFDTILEQERRFIPQESLLRDWHIALQNYFFYGPTPQTIRNLIRDSIPDFGPLQPLAENGAAYGFMLGTEIIRLNDEIIKKIDAFYQNFISNIIK